MCAAAYLARAGRSVCVLERRNVLGGAVVTEELVPGFKFSRVSVMPAFRNMDAYSHAHTLSFTHSLIHTHTHTHTHTPFREP